MKINTLTVLEADEGKILTDGETYGRTVIIPKDKSVEEFTEIPESKYEEIVKQALVRYQTNEGILSQTECEWDLKEDLVLSIPMLYRYNIGIV